MPQAPSIQKRDPLAPAQPWGFHVEKESQGARAGVLYLRGHAIPTPLFMPVGTRATVRALTPQELRRLGARVLLVNACHLLLWDLLEPLRRLGDLHRFMGWEGGLITDSGGFQSYSLSHLCTPMEEGLLFSPPGTSQTCLLTPELAVRVQEQLGADILMALDDCVPYGAGYAQVEAALERTHGWAQRCRQALREGKALFGIVQGGTFLELRRRSVSFLTSLDFPGYAVGGLSVGEPKALMRYVLEGTTSYLPQHQPRYLMGVGDPQELLEGIARGIDLFDSSLPTRLARHGRLLTPWGPLSLKAARCREQDAPIDPTCDCSTCATFSIAYLHYLFRTDPQLVHPFTSLHNLRFTVRLLARARRAILQERFGAFMEQFLSAYASGITLQREVPDIAAAILRSP